MTTVSTNGGLGNEKWYMSRRLWGTLASILAIVILNFAPDQYEPVCTMLQGLAAVSGGWSWSKPK